MKNLITLLTILLVSAIITTNILAQRIGDLHGINYQAVAIDEEGKEIVGMDIKGKPLYEKQIGVRFTIHKGQDGEIQYQETHTALTDKYGLFSLTIGKGQQTGNGTYSNLLSMPWIDADQWLKVEIAVKNDGNYLLVSLQQFMSVPYSFYTDDIADDAITTEKILNYTILNEDIATGSVDTRTILDETILNEDIATGAVDSRVILDGTILNEDIANGTIDLTSKVTNILPVENGGTGTSSLTDNSLLLGSGTGAVQSLGVAADGQIPIGASGDSPVLANITAGTGIAVTNTPGGIEIASTIVPGEVEADGVQSIDIGIIAAGSTYISPAFPVPGESDGQMGDIVLASIDKNLQGCMLTPYFFSSETIRIAIFNGTGTAVNLGNNVHVKLLIVK